MTQPTERRFVMEPRLDAEILTVNNALATKITNPAQEANIADGAVTNTKLADNSVTSAKIVNGTIVDADVSTTAAITSTKVQGTIPTGGTSGQVLAKSTSTNFETTWVDGTALPASQVKQIVKNETGASIPKGSVVYISGANGTNILISLADADTEVTSSKTVGLTESTIANGASGFVVTEGLLAGLNTSTATAGQSVWLSSTAGGFVYVNPPAKPAHSVYLGVVTRANISNGEIFVKVQNGYELEELHNVLITSPVNGQALTYDSATQLWKNATPISSLAGLSDVTITGPVSGEKLVYNGTKWVNLASAGSSITVADTAPSLSTASLGDAWLDSNDGTLYVCYIDQDATKLWMQVQANSALEGSILARLGSLEAQAIAYGTQSPNYIINGAFEVNQRAFSTTTGSGFTFDRWSVASSSGTVTYSNQAFAPGASPPSTVTGKNYLRCVTSGQSGASAYAIFAQAIEGVETLAGETITVSFWAKAASGTPKVALEMYRSYGAGGSPSADEQLYAGQVTLSTSMQRYSITYTLPSISGKTLGTTHTGYVKPQFWLSAGTDFNARTGSLGIQSNTFDIWGVQVERGSTATAFRRNANSIQGELAACQRYYYRLDGTGQAAAVYATGMSYTTTLFVCAIPLPVPMRATPTSLDSSAASTLRAVDGQSSWTGSTISLYTAGVIPQVVSIQLTLATTMTQGKIAHVMANASGATYIGFSAEL